MVVEDLSAALGVLAIWDGSGTTEYGLCYPDPRLPTLGMRVMLPLNLAKEAAPDLGAEFVEAKAYEAHRIALGVPRGGSISSTGTPSRTRPIWINLTASTSPRVATSDKRWFRASSIAAAHANASCRSQLTCFARRRRAGDGQRKADRHHGFSRRPKGSRCCGSITFPTRKRAIRRSWRVA